MRHRKVCFEHFNINLSCHHVGLEEGEEDKSENHRDGSKTDMSELQIH